MDFKALRIALGMQPCSATYSCAFCFGKAPFLIEAELRTFRSLRKNYGTYQALIREKGEKKAKAEASTCFNVVQESLILGEDHELLLFKCPPGELHLYLGTGNKLFDSLYKAMIEDIANGQFHPSVYEWAFKKSIVGLKYRGGALDGPNLGKLLKNLDSLRAYVPTKFHNFIECMELFDIVKKACFGRTRLDNDYKQKIKNFEIAYRNLGISVTPKVHCIFFEVPIFIEKHGKPLGFFTEQVFESMHSDWKPTWARYKRNENHPQFEEQLKSAVVNYNSLHV